MIWKHLTINYGCNDNAAGIKTTHATRLALQNFSFYSRYIGLSAKYKCLNQIFLLWFNDKKIYVFIRTILKVKIILFSHKKVK